MRDEQWHCDKRRPVTWGILGGSKPTVAGTRKRIGSSQCSRESPIIEDGEGNWKLSYWYPSWWACYSFFSSTKVAEGGQNWSAELGKFIPASGLKRKLSGLKRKLDAFHFQSTPLPPATVAEQSQLIWKYLLLNVRRPPNVRVPTLQKKLIFYSQHYVPAKK